jgi:hypothetical protein
MYYIYIIILINFALFIIIHKISFHFFENCGIIDSMKGATKTITTLGDLESYSSVKGVKYKVLTKLVSHKPPYILTSALIHGNVVDSIKSSLPPKGRIPVSVVKKLMREEHEKMKHRLHLKHATTNLSKGEFMRKIRRQIQNGNFKDALHLSEDARVIHPDNPFFMSYFGFLEAAVQKKIKEGLDICKTALDLYKSQTNHKEDSYYSYFHLNIGRVYLLSGKKDFAINDFRKGLKYDSKNKELVVELAKLGIRRPPPIPYLDRSNPINKYLGILMTKIGMR